MFDAYNGAQVPTDTMDKEELVERFKKIEEDIKQIFHEIDCIYEDIDKLQDTKANKIFKECD